MRSFLFLPPMAKISGGLAVLIQVAEHLARLNLPVWVVLREPERPKLPAWLSAPVVQWDDLRLRPDDLWMVPEGWVNALAPGLAAKAKCVVYVQNWAYLFSGLPDNVTWHDLEVSFLAVSRPVAWFIRQTLHRDARILPPGIDRHVFPPPRSKPSRPLQVAFMPRKNKAQSQLIKAIFESRAQYATQSPQWRPIHGMNQAEVAEELGHSHIFLATGHPEGCPLPPLEAMARGCLPVGFTGFGGWDYMTQIMPDVWQPWWPIPDNPWAGNGLWVADGDVLAAAMALEQAVKLWTDSGQALTAALRAGEQTVQAYDLEQQRKAVTQIWTQWMQDDAKI
jgi:hypothetical protein